LRKISTFKLN
jgi:hypothetical protein